MKRLIEFTKGIFVAAFILTFCYFGCYRNINTYSKWAKYEYNRLTDNSDHVFYTSFDMDKVYEEYLEILNETQFFTPIHEYNIPFKYEIRNENRVSKHQSTLSKPSGKSIAFIAPFSRYSTGAVKLEGKIFDLDWYVKNIENIIDNIDDMPDKEPWEYSFVSFLRLHFDYIYITYEKDGSTLYCVDIQEVLWRDND